MNRICPLFLLLVLLSSCNRSNDEKAQECVKNYCTDNFFNPELYQPISFDHVKVYNQEYEETDDYKSMVGRIKWLGHQKDSLYILMYHVEGREYHARQVDTIDKKIEDINANINAGKKEFKGIQEGWTITHTYIKSDEKGKTFPDRSTFVLNRDFTKVMQVIDK